MLHCHSECNEESVFKILHYVQDDNYTFFFVYVDE